MQPVNHPRTRRTLALSASVGILTAFAIGTVFAAVGVPVQQAHADDSSAVTITAADQDADLGDAPLPDLAVTVSQTRDLISQGLVVSWTGGKESTLPSGDTGGENFLQIMQCWGDDPTVPEGEPAQPDRTTCQYGAFLSAGATRDNFVDAAHVAPQDEQYTAPGNGFANPPYTSIPFQPVEGDLIASVVNHTKVDVNVNTNQYFTLNTSNEVKWAGSSSTGVGATRFEVQTALQAPGLGCGSPLTQPDGSIVGQSCWLVVIPRGTADAGEQHINKSGLLWDSWKHRLAVKLEFKPLGVSCAIGAAERQIAGSELAALAVASWQPTLCNQAGGSIYTLSTGTESDALAIASGTSPQPLALTSRPLDPSLGADPSVYAPIALTGLSIVFSVDRQPKASADTPADVAARANEPFTALKLTPRLLAKLLTNSYTDSLPTDADKTELGTNPTNLTFDPDFLAINESDWAYQALSSPALADLLTPQGRSDGAYQLWRYIMADKDAADFMSGKPDPWGMKVNPWNSTTASSNSSGNALVVPRDNFPKSDPVEQAGTELAGPVNLVTWRPYTNDFDQSAYLTLRGDGQVLGPWDVFSVPKKYGKAARGLQGFQKVLGLTDTASASRYQVISAQLLNPAGEFVAPTVESMTAAAAAMTKTASQAQVYEYDPAGSTAKSAPSAYPLTMPVYAATNPAQTDSATRASYSAFIRYASGAGQAPGTAAGSLPAGYAPLPQGWKDQAAAAATSIQNGYVAPTAATTTTTTTSNFGGGGVEQSVDAPNPEASGAGADLLGPVTPKDPDAGVVPAALPVSLLGGFAAAFAVPLMTRIRRFS